MEKKTVRVRWFDLVVLIVIIAAVVIGYRFTHRETVVTSRNIQYTFELVDNPEGFHELIHEGDTITDNVKNYYMGQVVSVEAIPYTIQVNDLENGVVREAEVPGRETVLVTVEAPVTENGGNLTVNGYFLVKTGLDVAVKGNGYAGRGYILYMDR
ncbi:MAG TPA: DUF4330 domain-containing protein [Firmicutes bacterium]|nr:DUF4330 domain-containing protein [Bacillota bacterium]